MRLKNKKIDRSQLYCFTPEVSLATFVIEVGFAIFVFFKYKSNTFINLCIALLICLGTFQLMEFLTCRYAYHNLWIQIGYVAITFLPAIGMHMASLLTKRTMIAPISSYIASVIISFMILFIPEVGLTAVCRMHYVEFFVNPTFQIIYALFYNAYILVALSFLISSLRNDKKVHTAQKWLVIAYFVFLIPTSILYYFKFILGQAVPSVMCGFAIITACIVVGAIIPKYKQSTK